MKKYVVTLHQKGLECFPYEVTVEVEDSEHPREKAVSIVCRLGWEVCRDRLQVVEVKRIKQEVYR